VLACEAGRGNWEQGSQILPYSKEPGKIFQALSSRQRLFCCDRQTVSNSYLSFSLSNDIVGAIINRPRDLQRKSPLPSAMTGG